MKASEIFKRIFGAVSDAVFPKDITCDSCGGELVADTRYRLCAKCLEELPIIDGHICLSCGAPIKDESDYCLRCQKNETVFERSRAPLVYDGEAKQLIHKFKFNGKKYIAETLGAMMADCFLKNEMQADVITFVPMTKSEFKRRGFNQSELLALEVGKRLNIPVLPALVKLKDTSAQKELGREEREKNLDGAFRCVFDEVKRLNVLLIDDIFTTGVTANECSKALLKGKAKSVSVLTATVTVLKPIGEEKEESEKELKKERKRLKNKKEITIDLLDE
ncbi:MAG: ComF family protein [Clostridia bacterium]|nr:ComF family protein [Clostridia bacterium]